MPTLTEPHAPIGILGGTFDPIHIGHLRAAEEVADALGLAHVRLIPAGAPPHRPPPHFSAAQRLQFCLASAAGNPRLIVDDREVHKTSPCYTIETLEALRQENPQTPLVLILGADAFLNLHKWHRWTELLDFCHIALVTRPGFDVAAQLPNPLRPLWNDHFCAQSTFGAVRAARIGKIISVLITPLDISATKIRGLLQAEKSARYLVSDAICGVLSAK